MQAAPDGATAVHPRDLTDYLPASHQLAGAHCRSHRLVLGAHAVVVHNDDDTTPSHPSGEDHPPGCRRPHQLASRSGDIDAQMAGTVTDERRVEPAQHP